jgi:hypothetical protein
MLCGPGLTHEQGSDDPAVTAARGETAGDPTTTDE